jgi:hypothetical protein
LFRNIVIIKIFLLFIFIILACHSPSNPQPVTESFLGQTAPGATPIRFAPQIISNNFYPHSKLIISPAVNRIYWATFLDTISSDKALNYSDFNGNNLSTAAQETTFDKYGILSFIFLNDNNHILFGSLQPYDNMEGRLVRAVWTSVNTDTGWSKPQAIESTVDTNWASVGSVSINGAGDIYFSGRMEGETAKIYCSKYVGGEYQEFEPLPEIINTGITLDPFIDYHDQFLLFAAANRVDNIGIIDLYISFKEDNGNWSEPLNLGQDICTQFIDRFPMITQDGKYLFFVTSHSDHFPSTYTHFYWVKGGSINI